MYVCICVDVCHESTSTAEAGRGHMSPGAGAAEGCEPPGWEPNLGPLEEQRVLLTSEPCQAFFAYFFF